MQYGNVLVVAADLKTAEEAIAAGRRPETVRGHLRPDCILEVKQTGKTTGEIVWRWNAWDHLVQDVDRSKPNYGD
ncbi:MAG: arylsulfotransferase (ASST), partial [Patescibacteria group bacterium]|nr:arylsulfotransferase (ASST) [Patescibacteria group bacterium]